MPDDSQTLVYLRSYFPVFELFCRLWLAVMSVVYGLLKLAVFVTESKTGGFTVMSLLHVLGVCVMATQLIGGALLLLGYKSIWIPWALTVSLLSSMDFINNGLGLCR